MHPPQQSGTELRIDEVRIDEVVEPDSPPFEFEDRTDPEVAREVATLVALTRWVEAQREAGHAPN